jgi:NDP-sugar pyrophosphorylase family protein
MGTETMLERQLRLLGSSGIRDVAVVVGWQGHQIEDRFGNRVAIRRNPDFGTTGSIHSLQVAADLLEGDVLILNSDLVFTGEMLDEMRRSSQPYVLSLQARLLRTTNTRTLLSGSIVLDIGKHIPAQDSAARFSGAAHVRREGMGLFRAAVLKCDSRLTADDWSTAFAAMIREGHRVTACIHDGPLFDVNSTALYAAARHYVAAETLAIPPGR